MKIKIKDKIYDGEIEPVMIILSERDKKNIANMSKDATKYCYFPDTEEWIKNDYEKIRQWMKEV